MKSDVIIVGGGASGLVAAIVCARNGSKVTILEHKDKIGKKILATGNGKCNYTNLYQEKECYRCDEDTFVMEALGCFGTQETVAFFKELGIYPKDKNGYLYPNSEQASSILDVLRMELDHFGVVIQCGEHVKHIVKKNNGFQVKTQNGSYESNKVILSTGGCASSDLGSDGSGYLLAKTFGHHIIDVVPALTALRSQKKYFKAVAGVRVEAKLTLLVEGKIMDVQEGELQLTNYGISGIPVFQLSRFASKALHNNKNVSVLIDLLPYLTMEETYSMWSDRIEGNGYKTLEQSMIGLLNRKLVTTVIKEAGLDLHTLASKLTRQQVNKLVCTIKGLSVTIDAANPFENAQVSAGGVSVKEIDASTMESKLVPGLYLTGELLDVDGICGGYNLQWAWTTGYLAGINAGKELK